MASTFFQKVRLGFRELIRFNLDFFLGSLSWRLPNWLFIYVRTVVFRTNSLKIFTRNITSYFQRFATLDDVKLIEGTGVSHKLLKERLENGDRCYFVGQDDKILSVIWGSEGKRFVKFCGVILDPGDDGIILYGGFSEPAVMLKGLFPVAYKRLHQSYIDEGRENFYAAVHATNKHSIKLHRRMNFDEVGEAVHVVIFGIKFTYYKYWPHKTKKLHIFYKTFPDDLFWN